MKETIRLVVVLTVFCAVAALLLAWTDSATKARIEQERKAETIEALGRVLPPCDNDLLADARIVKDGGTEWTFYAGRKTGTFVGAAFQSEAAGYGGPIKLLVGLLPDGALNGVQILAADKETPGLGSKVSKPEFLRQFAGQSAADAGWAAVKRDGGQIQAITGATISSRAVARAVRMGLEVYTKHGPEIRGAN